MRKLSGIGFPGTPATMTALLGDVELPGLPEEYIFMRRCQGGHFSAIALEPGWHRVFTSEYDHVADRDEPATFEQLRESLIRLAGTDYGMHNPKWISRFGDAARQASQYRAGRVLLAGDAAHIHYPAGGQGLNIGVQDAVNLGWKLALVARGQAPESLLDSYHAERHPVAERVLNNTRAQAALARPGTQADALRELFGSLLVFDDVNQLLGGMITGLDIRYPVDSDHLLVGRRVPDVDLKTPDGDTWVYALLHTAHPVLLDLRGSVEVAAVADAWADRVDLVEARSEDDHWPVPAVGEIPAPAALLVRPRRPCRLGRHHRQRPRHVRAAQRPRHLVRACPAGEWRRLSRRVRDGGGGSELRPRPAMRARQFTSTGLLARTVQSGFTRYSGKYDPILPLA